MTHPDHTIPNGYKLTEVGVIPDDWEVKAIGEIAPLQRGFDLPNSQLKDGDYPVVYSNGVQNFHNKATCIAPGVVTGRSGTLGAIHYIERDYWAHNTALWVTDFKGNNPKYIYYLYLFIGFERFGSGSGVPTLNRNDAHAFRIAISTNYSEQRAIAKALSEIDDQITALEESIAKKRELKQGAMQRLLTGEERLDGFSGEWEVKRLGDVINDFRGGAPLEPNDFIEYGFKVLSKGGVVKRGILKINDDDQQFCSNEYASKHRNNVVDNKYTIVVLRDLVPSGPTIGLMVKIPSSDKYVLAQGVYGFIVDRQVISADYLIQLSNTPQYRYLMQSIMVGSTQVHITNTAFQNIEIDFPPLDEQQAIADVLSNMDAEISALEAERDKTITLKQGMMQELLTGKTRLI